MGGGGGEGTSHRDLIAIFTGENNGTRRGSAILEKGNRKKWTQ